MDSKQTVTITLLHYFLVQVVRPPTHQRDQRPVSVVLYQPHAWSIWSLDHQTFNILQQQDRLFWLTVLIKCGSFAMYSCLRTYNWYFKYVVSRIWVYALYKKFSKEDKRQMELKAVSSNFIIQSICGNDVILHSLSISQGTWRQSREAGQSKQR